MPLPRPSDMADVVHALNALIDVLEQRLPARTYTTTTKPDATTVPVGTIIYVSNGAPGAVFQASSGSAWINLG